MIPNQVHLLYPPVQDLEFLGPKTVCGNSLRCGRERGRGVSYSRAQSLRRDSNWLLSLCPLLQTGENNRKASFCGKLPLVVHNPLRQRRESLKRDSRPLYHSMRGEGGVRVLGLWWGTFFVFIYPSWRKRMPGFLESFAKHVRKQA